jgi:glycosyltransferase involved in cell wall biosynthesis
MWFIPMKISICIATYNGAAYIYEQLSSILISLKYSNIEDFEVIISDDGSLDLTIAILKNFSDPRIFILKGPGEGVIRNFELLVNTASGDVIFLSDQDDVWAIDKIAISLNGLKNNDLVVSDALIVDEKLNLIKYSFFDINNSKPGLLLNLFKNSYIGCCMCFKKSALIKSKCMPFPKDIPMHDWWIGLCFEIYADIIFLKKPLIQYRRHKQNLTGSSLSSRVSYFKRIGWRLILIKNLIFRFFKWQ